jgi:hypothetical protein
MAMNGALFARKGKGELLRDLVVEGARCVQNGCGLPIVVICDPRQ